LGEFALEGFDTGGESCQLCRDLTLMIDLRGLFVRAHGNYCTAIASGVVLKRMN
jgi:hypothetical protein